MTAIYTGRVFRPDPRTIDIHEEHHRVGLSARHVSPTTVLVTVDGEVDATNSRALASYVERHLAGTTRLVLDLRMVDFFGTAGFAALHNINVICCGYDVSWSLQAGRRVRRLLEICDPDGVLPLETSQSVLDDVYAGAGDRQFLVGGQH